MVARILNWVLLALSVLALVWRMFVMRRPFPIESKGVWRGVLTAPIAMAAYAVVLGAGLVTPLGFYLFAAGVIVGGLLGLLTRVRLEGETAVGRRAWFYLVFWTAIYLLTQWIGTAVGDGGVTVGLTLMLLPLGMGVTQDLMLLARATATVRRFRRTTAGAAAAGAAVGLVVVLLSGLLLANPCTAQTPLADVRFPGDDWTQAAAIEFNRGKYQEALDLALAAERYYGQVLAGEWQAKSQLVAGLAATELDDPKAGELMTRVSATLTKALQQEGCPPGEIAGRVSSITARLRREITSVRPAAYQLRAADVVYVAPYGAVYRQDIPRLWERYGSYLKKYAPELAELLAALLPLIQAMGASEPITPEKAAAAAAVMPVVILSSTLLDFRLISELAKRRGVTGVVTSRAGVKPAGQRPATVSAKELAEFGKLAADLQAKMKAAAEAGADLPLSLTEWRPDRPTWLDLLRRAVEKYREYEDQVEAAGEVRELIGEFTETEEFAALALSRLQAVILFLQGMGLLTETWGARVEEMARKSGARSIKDLLKTVDAAGRDPAAVVNALTGAIGGDPLN